MDGARREPQRAWTAHPVEMLPTVRAWQPRKNPTPPRRADRFPRDIHLPEQPGIGPAEDQVWPRIAKERRSLVEGPLPFSFYNIQVMAVFPICGPGGTRAMISIPWSFAVATNRAGLAYARFARPYCSAQSLMATWAPARHSRARRVKSLSPPQPAAAILT